MPSPPVIFLEGKNIIRNKKHAATIQDDGTLLATNPGFNQFLPLSGSGCKKKDEAKETPPVTDKVEEEPGGPSLMEIAAERAQKKAKEAPEPKEEGSSPPNLFDGPEPPMSRNLGDRTAEVILWRHHHWNFEEFLNTYKNRLQAPLKELLDGPHVTLSDSL